MRGGTRRTSRLLVALVALVAVGSCSGDGDGDGDGTAGPAPTTTVAPTTTTTAPPECSPSGEQVTAGGVDSAMGTRTSSLVLHNCGSVPFEVNGYPGIRLLDEEDRPVEAEVVEGSGIVEDPGPAPLVVAPGEAVLASLSWRNRVETLDAPAVGATVVVTVRPGEPAHTVPLHVDIGTTGRVEVTAWQPWPPGVPTP